VEIWLLDVQLIFKCSIKLRHGEDILYWSKNSISNEHIARLGYASLLVVDVEVKWNGGGRVYGR
jgi:hypothetical protein